MPLPVADVIDEARDAHPAFTPEHAPGPAVRRFLSRYQDRLVSKIVVLNPDRLNVDIDVTLPFGDFDAGATLPEAHTYRAGRAHHTNGLTEDFKLIPYDNLPVNREFPAGYILGTTLHLVGQESDWTTYAKVVIGHVPVSVQIAEGGSFVLPDSARDVLVMAAQDFMAGRLAARKDGAQVDVNRFRTDWLGCEKVFLREQALFRRENTTMTQERW